MQIKPRVPFHFSLRVNQIMLLSLCAGENFYLDLALKMEAIDKEFNHPREPIALLYG